MSLALVALQPPFWQEYLHWQVQREKPWPHGGAPSLGLWVATTEPPPGYHRQWQPVGVNAWGWGPAHDHFGYQTQADGPWLVPLAGLAIFQTDGPFMLADHFATNPDVPPRLRHEAGMLIARTLSVVGAVMGKAMSIAPNSRSLELMLLRAGFQFSRHRNGRIVQAMYTLPIRVAQKRAAGAVYKATPAAEGTPEQTQGGPQTVATTPRKRKRLGGV